MSAEERRQNSPTVTTAPQRTTGKSAENLGRYTLMAFVIGVVAVAAAVAVAAIFCYWIKISVRACVHCVFTYL